MATYEKGIVPATRRCVARRGATFSLHRRQPPRWPAWRRAAGSDKIRIALVGCGSRGTGAAFNCIESSPGVEIVALGDVFKDRLESSRNELSKNLPVSAYRVTKDRCFVGFDAYQHVLATDVDLVLLATPAHFRPIHLKAAIEAGKHAFIEKPVAVDPVGARSIIASSESAARKGLAIVAGTQRRHDARCRDIIGRIHDGAIGELTGAHRCCPANLTQRRFDRVRTCNAVPVSSRSPATRRFPRAAIAFGRRP